MKAISKSNHDQLVELARALEHSLEMEMNNYNGHSNQLNMPAWKELNHLKEKRIGLNELFRKYQQLLKDLDVHIAAYQSNQNQIRFELKKYKRAHLKRQRFTF